MISLDSEAKASPVATRSGWTTQVYVDPVYEGSQSYHAQVFRGGRCLCHIVMAGVAVEAGQAEEALAMRVRRWIDAFEARDFGGAAALQAS